MPEPTKADMRRAMQETINEEVIGRIDAEERAEAAEAQVERLEGELGDLKARWDGTGSCRMCGKPLSLGSRPARPSPPLLIVRSRAMGEPSYMSAYNFLEREAGLSFHRAMIVCEMQSAAEAAVAEFEHDEGLEEYVALCRRLADWEPLNFDG